MALSQDAKKRLIIALTDEAVGAEVASAIESGSNPRAASVAAMGVTANLPAVPASFADLAEARTAVNDQRTAVEARLDAIELKIDALLAALKAAGLMDV